MPIYNTYGKRPIFAKKKRKLAFFLIPVFITASAFAAKICFTQYYVEKTPASPEPLPAATAAMTALPEAAAEETISPVQTGVTAGLTQNVNLLKTLERKDGIKTAYLTFDDGPTTSVTPKILDILRRYNIKATFFEQGVMIEANPDVARRVYEEGHLIGNHSYTHNYNEVYASEQAFISEIEKVESLIKHTTGQENIFKVFRFPGGSDGGKWNDNKQSYKQTLSSMGYVYCDWNALNGDAEGGVKTAEQLIEEVKETTSGKEDVVILMHDSPAKKTTVEALPAIIEYLISQGYRFSRLDG
ncbi:MAG: polysaccharide deacetylase [Clostridia bacterium]|nr:polysaccharide deacetylase [Clostridia bacterium]